MKVAFERKLNMLVGIPSNGLWNAQFGMSLLNAWGYFMATKVEGYREQRIQPVQIRGSILSRSRAKMVQEARKHSCTHVCFVDTDQTFPRDTFHRLLSWKKDVVACNIATKRIPAAPTARKKDVFGKALGGAPVYTEEGQTGLERVWRVGTGIMLVDMKVFDKIGEKCFDIKWREELQDYQGEDWSMCEAMEEAGFEIYVDHGLSNQVGHVGDFEYTHEVIGETTLVEDRTGKKAIEL